MILEVDYTDDVVGQRVERPFSHGAENPVLRVGDVIGGSSRVVGWVEVVV